MRFKRKHHENYKRLIMFSILLCESGLAPSSVEAQQPWPLPIPCRIQDGRKPEVISLGSIETNLADGRYLGRQIHGRSLNTGKARLSQKSVHAALELGL
jgi:hypothetical protein